MAIAGNSGHSRLPGRLCYYRFIGCSGGCAITSSPYISTLYGGVIGLLLSVVAAPEKG